MGRGEPDLARCTLLVGAAILSGSSVEREGSLGCGAVAAVGAATPKEDGATAGCGDD
jgi:hypothetical protein